MQKNKSIKALAIIVGLVALLVGYKTVYAQTGQAPKIVVSADQVNASGFTGATVQPVKGVRFMPPLFYFHVKETVSVLNAAAWGDSANLVAVLIQPITDKSWIYNNGQMEVRDISGRTQVRVSSPGYYIIATGPDKLKTMTLVNNLKVLY